jgi:hypothetical protein
MRKRWRLALVAIVLAAAAAAAAAVLRRPRTVTLQGAVILSHAEAMEESPIADVFVSAADDLAPGAATSDFSGYFKLPLRPGVSPGELVTLQFRHPGYRPLDVQVAAGDALVVTRLSPANEDVEPAPEPKSLLSHLIVRYSAEATVATNVGSAARTFEVVNTGNVPCERGSRCSPDGRWTATVGGVSIDAGLGNEFRNTRLSCIAGPCPFTRIASDEFSKGGRIIGATVLNWSDTTTFVLEAEVVRPQLTNTIQHSYPIILGRRLNFSLPASADGATIEAEVDGEQIVFPLGPSALLSWADCEVRTERNQTKTYRCELKPSYGFKDEGQ